MHTSVTIIDLFIFFVFIHCIADFSLQSAYVAEQKNPKKNPKYWTYILFIHSNIHAGLLFLFSFFLLQYAIVIWILELLAHFCIDWLKCTKRINFIVDQTLHILCKFSYCVLIFYGIIY